MNFRSATTLSGLLLAAMVAWPASASDEQALAVRAPVTDAGNPAGFSLTYDVYTGGFRALRLDFAVAFDGETPDYRTDISMETSGLVGFMFNWRFDAMSNGVWRDGEIVPERYHTANVWRGNERAVSIDYEDGVAAKVLAVPPYSEEDMKKVAPAMIPGAVDPTSAVTALVLTSALQGDCRPTTAIYDGRRRYDALTSPLPPRDLQRSSQAPFVGQAEGCKLTFKRIAGFKPRKQRVQDLEVDVWLADVGVAGGGLPGRVPVRLELSTPWGDGFGHLVRARDSSGSLIFGEPGDD
ncbi:MAG: DUF3108 domain-containing protein [Alphaproteobacteria bacterium]|nr:DUF3108 domain-containing protein [Alphaproteobacteria bacterium]